MTKSTVVSIATKPVLKTTARLWPKRQPFFKFIFWSQALAGRRWYFVRPSIQAISDVTFLSPYFFLESFQKIFVHVIARPGDRHFPATHDSAPLVGGGGGTNISYEKWVNNSSIFDWKASSIWQLTFKSNFQNTIFSLSISCKACTHG